MINDLSTLLRLMEQGFTPKHADGGWTILQPDHQTGEPTLVEVSTFAITQAKKFNSIEVVKTEDGYEAILAKDETVVDRPGYAGIPADLSALSSSRRLNSLAQTGLFNSPPTEEFDRLTRLAASVLKCPISLVTFVSADQQFIKSSFGLTGPMAKTRTGPISDSLCKYVASNGKELVLCDTHEHSIVSDVSMVRELNVRAYAGFPIVSMDGQVLGAFCVADIKPRHWSKTEMELLKNFASMANLCIAASEMRMKLAALRFGPSRSSQQVGRQNHGGPGSSPLVGAC